MSGPGHHIIQRYHLAQFAGDQPKGQVWIYNKKTGTMRSDIPENISVENNYYSIEAPDGWDTRFDDWITDVEGKAKPVYDQLLAEQIPDYSQAKYDFSVYLALTHVRTRTQRRATTDFYGKMLQQMMHAMASQDDWYVNSLTDFEKKQGKNFSPETRQELRDLMLNPAGKVTLSISKNITFASWGVIDKLAPILLNMQWSIVRPERGFFITSDNPLLKQVAEGTTHPIYGDGGYMNKTVNVTFPLSPKKMLLLSHKKYPRSIWETPREYVDAANRARAAHAEADLHSHIKHKGLAKMALEFKDSRLSLLLKGGAPVAYADINSPRRFKQ
jgi:hypothetical protein